MYKKTLRKQKPEPTSLYLERKFFSSTLKVSNPCIRCGKERIESKHWEEKVVSFIGTSNITYTEMVCPDPECQKIVDVELKAKRDKKVELDAHREEEKNTRKTLRKAKK